jgi:hypothetical protein
VKPIQNELIEAMPSSVEASKPSCEAAADATLHVLFLMAAELDPKVDFPPIISNGVELWPLPPPYETGERRTVPLMVDLNGTGATGGYLEHCRRNAEEFNRALEEAKPDVAKEIAKRGPTDATHVWNFLNSLALSVEDEDVYRPIELSDETKQAYYQAVGIARET